MCKVVYIGIGKMLPLCCKVMETFFKKAHMPVQVAKFGVEGKVCNMGEKGNGSSNKQYSVGEVMCSVNRGSGVS